jgi:hypothetical protein
MMLAAIAAVPLLVAAPLILPQPPSTAPTTRSILFGTAPTSEAGAKLSALNSSYEERAHHFMLTHEDVLRYESTNRDIARWYLKALLRAQARDLFRISRRRAREERERERILSRARGARIGGGWNERDGTRGPASLSDSLESRDRGGFAGFVADVSDFIEQFTNEGITFPLPIGHAHVRYAPENSRILAHVAVPSAHVGVDVRAGPSSGRVPYLWNFGDGAERLIISAGATAWEGGPRGTVGYEYQRQRVSAALSANICDGLSARVSRAWNFAAASPTDAAASIEFSRAL